MKYPFTFVGELSTSPLANLATQDITIVIPQQTVFTCRALRAFTDIDTNAQIEPLGFDVRIQDSGSNKFLSNGFVPRNLVFSSLKYGTGGDLPQDIIFQGGSTIIFNVKNTSGGNLVRVTLAMVGLRED